MEKTVYKITNNINGKIYIGQTNNLKRRIQEHKHDKRKDTYLYRAIHKYGWENFSVEILYQGEDYNQEEKKWIAYYEAQNRDKGYNLVSGGQDSSGEDNPGAVLTQQQADRIIELLKDENDLSCEQIAEEAETSVKNVYNINSGVAWATDNIQYPIRQLMNVLTDEIVGEIYRLLLQTEMKYEEIGKIYNIPAYRVYLINNGKSYRKDGYTYPLRDLQQEQREAAKYIIYLLSNTKLMFKEISELTGKSISIISRINLGKNWVQEGIQYPIRKYK